MKRLVVGLTALALLIAAASSAQARGKRRGHCAPPPCSGYVGSGVSYRYVTEWRDVQRTVCEWVADTKEQDVTETYCKAETKTEDRTVTWYEQKWETVRQPRTVYRCVLENQPRSYYVPVMKSKTEDQTFTVARSKWVTEARDVTVCVPAWRTEDRQVSSVVYDRVPVVKTCMVPCPPPCDPCGRPCGPAYKTVSYTAWQCMPRTVVQNFQVNVYAPRYETRQVNVNVCKVEYVNETRPVTRTWCENELRNDTVQVSVMKAFTEDVDVQVCKWEQKSRTDQVQVTSHKWDTRTVRKPVTTYKMQTRVVTEKVPVTVCVPVVAAAAPCGPVAVAPAPCY